MLIYSFTVLQTILLLCIILHDWISIPPFNNLAEEKVGYSYSSRIGHTFINTFWVMIPLLLIYFYRDSYSFFVAINIAFFYSGLTIGTIHSWWIPYFFGSSKQHKESFKIFKNTHYTLHVILHLQIWFCCLIAWYLVFLS